MPASIRGRLFLFAGGLTAAALVLAWLALSALLSEFVTRRILAELEADARAAMASAEWDLAGNFSVVQPPADPRFERPLSGWYWQVSDGSRVLARSPSLVTGDLGPDGGGRAGPDGAALMAHGSTFTAPGDGRPLRVTVTLPVAEVRAELATIRAPLAAALAVLGLALMLAQVVAVRAGLADLTRFARAVALVRDGRAGALPPPRAGELVPLAAELDRLIAANRAQVERVRAHAGDLAHALKTPLAVLANRARPEDAPLLSRMDRLVRWHLERARAAAAGLDPRARAPVGPVLDDVALVLGPEAGRRGVRLAVEAGDAPAFRGDAEDLAEMAGNLADNAVKWAATRVRVAARAEDGRLVIEVEDDGPGIPHGDRARLLDRGVRLDQTTPGHGLGLAIVADRAALYGGTIELGSAPGGGLLARLTLPAAG